MTDDPNDALYFRYPDSDAAAGRLADLGAPDGLAQRVISVLRKQQSTTHDGARTFVLEHLLRAICKAGPFDPYVALDVMRGHRIPMDRVIEIYIPQTARRLGELWVDDEIDFATVTIGVLRLQALLAEVSGQVFHQPNASHGLHALVVVPPGEQHFLGASVAAAQLRRLGCETEMSFAEEDNMLVRRARYDKPDMILFTCARYAGLERIGHSVKQIRSTVPHTPVIAVGGALKTDKEIVEEISGADIVTTRVIDVIAFCAQRRKAMSPG